jgi:NhaC family Na+:H+ antiporter
MQPDVVLTFAASPELPAGLAMVKGVVMALANGYVANTGVAAVDDLLSRGGMGGMLVTIWLILSAMALLRDERRSSQIERLRATPRALLRAISSQYERIADTIVQSLGHLAFGEIT